MEKVICIKSCVNTAGDVSINSGDLFWTPYDKDNLKSSFNKWISLYSTNSIDRIYYIGSFECINFRELGEWRESRMGQILD